MNVINSVIRKASAETFDFIRSYINLTVGDLQVFVSELSGNVSYLRTQSNVNNMLLQISQVQNYYLEPGAFDTACHAILACLNDQNLTIMESFESSSDSLRYWVNQSVIALSDADNLIGNVTAAITGTIGNVISEVDSFEVGTLESTFGDVDVTIANIIGSISRITDAIESWKRPVFFFLYAGSLLLTLVVLLYGFAFFFRNCFTRCLAASFPCFAFFITLLTLAPAVVFACFFFLFYEICPEMETVIQEMMGDDVFPGNVAEVFSCPSPMPISDLMYVGFNYSDVIEELMNAVSGYAIPFEIPAFAAVSQFGNHNWGQLSYPLNTSMFFDDAESEFSEIEDAGCSGSNLNLIELETIGSSGQTRISGLNPVLEAAFRIGDQSIGAKSRGEAMAGEIESLVPRFGEEAKLVLKQGLDNVTCETTKCIYAPLKNSLCGPLLGGMALWIISAVPLIIGLFCMELSICFRRLQLEDPTIIRIHDGKKEPRSTKGEVSSDGFEDRADREPEKVAERELTPDDRPLPPRIKRREPTAAVVPMQPLIPIAPVEAPTLVLPVDEDTKVPEKRSLVSLLISIRESHVIDQILRERIQEFDAKCIDAYDRTHSWDADSLEPSRGRIRFAFPEKKDSRGGRRNSSDSDFSSGSEDSDEEGIWHSRRYVEEDIDCDASCVAFGKDVAAFLAEDSSGQPKVCICPYRSTKKWTAYKIETKGEELAVTLSAAWVLHQDNIRRVPLNFWDQPASFDLLAPGIGKLCLWEHGICAVFDGSNEIFTITEKAEPKRFRTAYTGFACVSSCGQNIVAGVRDSGTVHMFSGDGREVRCFAGHCGPVSLIEKISDSVFASKGDETIRIWDLRSIEPVSTVLINEEVWMTCLAGCDPFLAFGCDKRRIGCVDLRRMPGKALVGVRCGEYEPLLMKLDEEGSLAVFAKLGNTRRRKGANFNAESEGIFRLYSKFV
jgi:hypothetical protein